MIIPRERDWIDRAEDVIDHCTFPNYTFHVEQSHTGTVYLQASYEEADVITGNIEEQFTRRWYLSPKMTKSEIVATAFKCVMTSMEHRTREWFQYRAKAIYQPHYDVDELHKICELRDARNLVEA